MIKITEPLFEKVVPGATLTGKLQWLKKNAESGKKYRVELTADDSQSSSGDLFKDPNYLNYGGKRNITITLEGKGGMRTVDLTGTTGLHFFVSDGVTFILGSNITLRGTLNNDLELVQVFGGSFIMRGGTITGNTPGNSSGAVDVSYTATGKPTSTFTMTGGTISNNTGNGVYVTSSTFNMTGGTISGNIASGVFMTGNNSYGNCYFTMSGGSITNNLVGYGVYINSGAFTHNGGVLSGNQPDDLYP